MTLNRHDIESCRLFGDTMALEVAITALLRSHPAREELKRAFAEAEDMGYTWTEDHAFDSTGRGLEVQRCYLETLARLRQAAIS